MLNKLFSIRFCFSSIVLFFYFTNTSFAALLFQDNFNYSDSPNNHGWSAGSTSSIASGAGPDSSNALKITFNCDSGTCGNRWNDWAATANTQELYVKFNFKMDCGSGSCIGGAKFLKFFGIRNGDNYANTTTQLVWETAKLEGLLYGCYGTSRDAASAIWYDGSTTNCPHSRLSGNLAGPIDPRNGQWHTWEVHLRYNDDGQNNGIYEVWYDNTKVLGAIGINNRDNTNSKYLGSVQLGGWNQYYGGKPYYIYYDNVIISTTRGGEGGNTLQSPSNLRIIN